MRNCFSLKLRLSGEKTSRTMRLSHILDELKTYLFLNKILSSKERRSLRLVAYPLRTKVFSFLSESSDGRRGRRKKRGFGEERKGEEGMGGGALGNVNPIAFCILRDLFIISQAYLDHTVIRNLDSCFLGFFS